MDKFILILLARPLGSDRGERDHVIAVGENVVQRETGRAPGKLGDLAEQRDHLSDALVVARQRAAAGNVPHDVLGEELTLQRAEVSAPEGRVGLPYPVLVGLRHLILPPHRNPKLRHAGTHRSKIRRQKARPGLRMPAGSSAVLIAWCTASDAGPSCCRSQACLSTPTPCSPVTVPPSRRAWSQSRSPAAMARATV